MPISYAPTSWNPAVGCTAVSEGCDHCWARKLHNQRYNARLDGAELPGQYDMPFDKIRLLPHRLDQPLRWRKPRTVAVCFMGDLFHDGVPDGFLSHVWGTMADAERHTFLILTKRPERMRAFLLNDDLHRQPYWDYHGIMPLRNVWLGVTAENQERADERMPLLLDTPGKHWVSIEPALGAVDLRRWVDPLGELDGQYRSLVARGMFNDEQVDSLKRPILDWVVVGGESGSGYREMDQAWVWDIFDQCRHAEVPYYGKQRAAVRSGQPLPGDLGRKETPWAALAPPDGQEPPEQEGV